MVLGLSEMLAEGLRTKIESTQSNSNEGRLPGQKEDGAGEGVKDGDGTTDGDRIGEGESEGEGGKTGEGHRANEAL